MYLNLQYWNGNLKNNKLECYTGRIINLCHCSSYMSKTHIETSYLGLCPHSLQTVLFWLWSVYNQGHFTQCVMYHFSCMSALNVPKNSYVGHYKNSVQNEGDLIVIVQSLRPLYIFSDVIFGLISELSLVEFSWKVLPWKLHTSV